MDKLPPDWIIAHSKSQNCDYYYNKNTNANYWKVNDLPFGWVKERDAQNRTFYFHIITKQETYEKPPLLAPSRELEMKISQDQVEQESIRSDDTTQASDTSTLQIVSPRETTFERRKSNSLIDLLSPGPPASVQTDHMEHNSYPQKNTHPSKIISTTNRKRSIEEMEKTDAKKAEDFYNKLNRDNALDRTNSRLFHMRSMNNWIKSILIKNYARENDKVLDLACGKGGDLKKWANAKIAEYTGVDIAKKSLEDAIERLNPWPRYLPRISKTTFVQCDLGESSLTDDELDCWSVKTGWTRCIPLVRGRDRFDIISVQFALHYMFGSRTRANHFFKSISSVLKPGGHVIATTVDPNAVLQYYYQQVTKAHLLEKQESEEAKPDVQILDEKDRQVCAIQFDDSLQQQLLGRDLNDDGEFGLRYTFTLSERTDVDSKQNAVDAPEYLVRDDVLQNILNDYGFKILAKENFQPFIRANEVTHKSMLESMNVLNYKGTITDAEWKVIGLYQVLVLKKL